MCFYRPGHAPAFTIQTCRTKSSSKILSWWTSRTQIYKRRQRNKQICNSLVCLDDSQVYLIQGKEYQLPYFYCSFGKPGRMTGQIYISEWGCLPTYVTTKFSTETIIADSWYLLKPSHLLQHLRTSWLWNQLFCTKRWSNQVVGTNWIAKPPDHLFRSIGICFHVRRFHQRPYLTKSLVVDQLSVVPQKKKILKGKIYTQKFQTYHIQTLLMEITWQLYV